MRVTKIRGEVGIDACLDAQTGKSLLRFIVCGSADDGKSTLIDGLAAGREEGITIDVTQRFFSTDRRNFIVADTSGHEQYTRTLVTAAASADLAVILVDARQGMMTQTCRHSFISSLMGIKHLVLAVNKMDLVAYDEALFNEICSDYLSFAEKLNFSDIHCIPVSAREGDNIVSTSERTPWYSGPSLLRQLEDTEVDDSRRGEAFRLPVQWDDRPDHGYSGTIAGGSIAPGAAIVVMPSGGTGTVEKITSGDDESAPAGAGRTITLTLRDEIDILPGDVICSDADPIQISDQLQTHIVWMHDYPMVPGRQYTLRSAAATTSFVVTELKHKINVDTLETQAAKTLERNEIGVANLSLHDSIAFDPYKVNRKTGSFTIVDLQSNDTVGAGLFDFSLRRADNVVWQALTIDKFHRSAIKNQKSCVLWMTGLSGSGKSTIANMLEARLHDMHRHTYVLDGDNVRHGLNRDLGFVEVDRVENIRRVGETAKLMVDAGLITIVSFISPFASDRKMARELLEPGEFTEIYISTPLDVCEKRDPKGLYKKARAGEIKNFTGVGAGYEAPVDPELLIPTHEMSPEQAVEKLIDYLQERGFLTAPEL